MEPYQPKWPTERKIWEVITKLYDGNLEHVKSLQQRLLPYFSATPPQQRALKTGLEELSSDDSVQKSIEQVVDAKFNGYRRVVDRGMGHIYDENDPSFLKEEPRDKRDWLIRYAALMHISNKDNKLVNTVTDFVDDVQTLLIIYHNLEVERHSFYMNTGQGLNKSVVENVEANRRNLIKEIKSKDEVIKTAAQDVLNHSYFMSESILMHLYGFATSLNPHDLESRKINLEELEAARAEIAKNLRGLPGFDTLIPQVKNFYLGNRSVPELVKGKQSVSV